MNNDSIRTTPYHNCIQVTLENDYFKEKLKQFYIENKSLKEKISKLEIKLIENQSKENKPLNKENSSQNYNIKSKIPIRCKPKTLSKSPIIQTTSNVVENNKKTESTRCTVCSNRIKLENASTSYYNCSCNSNNKQFDSDIYNQRNKKSYVKLCEMQHDLLKKYQDEVNANTVKQDLINHMNLELEDYESKCTNFLIEIDKLKERLESMNNLEIKYKKLLIDHQELKLLCKKYAQEIKSFDETFFDEIEDLKYNYTESLKLNKYYEYLLNHIKSYLPGNYADLLDKKQKRHVKFKIDQTIDKEIDNDGYESTSSDSEINFLDIIEKHYKKVEDDCKAATDDDYTKYVNSTIKSKKDSKIFDFDKFIGIDSLTV